MTSAIRGTADSLCSLRAFPSLTDTVIHQRRLTPYTEGMPLPPRCRMTASLRATATLALRSPLREDVGCHCNLYRHDDCRDFSVVSGLDRLCVSADLFGLVWQASHTARRFGCGPKENRSLGEGCPHFTSLMNSTYQVTVENIGACYGEGICSLRFVHHFCGCGCRD
jgi:hypothetical protein